MTEQLEEIGLTAPEIKLWQALESGKLCRFHLKASDVDRTLRGDILGKILRGDAVKGVKPPKLPRQVKIYGAVISGVLDMSDTDSGITLIMRICHVKDRPNFRRAHFAYLDFKSSRFEKGANFIKLITGDNLWLDKIESNGEFNLISAKIGGQFSASEAYFSNPDGDAIFAQGVEVKGDVFLRKANVTGCTSFNGAKIGEQFDAREAHFLNPDGKAIFAQDAEIKGGVFLTGFPHPPIGTVDFINAKIGHIIINDNSYPLGRLSLDGTRYPNIDVRGHVGKAVPMEGWLSRPSKRNFNSTDEIFLALKEIYGSKERARETRKKLLNADTNHERTPFAYRQFARVLDAHGHEREARDVRIHAQHETTRRRVKSVGVFHSIPYIMGRSVQRRLVSYGLKPMRIFIYLICLWIIGLVVFGFNHAHMTPAKERFYLSQVNYAADGVTFESYKELSPSITLPKGYPTYSPLIYSLDVMLPVVDFAQETHWRPKNTKGFNWLRVSNRVYLAFGWAFSTIAVLGFTGLISDKKDKD